MSPNDKQLFDNYMIALREDNPDWSGKFKVGLGWYKEEDSAFKERKIKENY